MSLKFFYDAENSNNISGTDYSSGDTTGFNANTTFVGAAAKTGAYGLTGNTGVQGSITFSATNIFPSAATPNTSIGAMGFWIKWLTGNIATGTTYGMRGYGSTTNDRIGFEGMGGSSGMAIVCANTTGSAVFRANSNTGVTTANTWYFVVGRWDIPAGKMKIEIYTDAGNNSLSLADSKEYTGAALSTTYCPSTAFVNLNVGVRPSGETDVIYADHFMLADTYDAPLQENAFITNYANYSESVTFTSAPTVSSQTNTAYTVAFTPSMSGTMYGVATIAGSATPSMAQIKAGQNGSGGTAKASVTKAVPVGANTVILTPSDSPAFPRYDLHFVFASATSNSAIATLTSEYLDPPSGKIFTTLTSVDSTSPLYGTGTAANDTVVLDALTSPDNYDVSCVSDGTVSYTASGDSNRQIIAADVYDYSAGAYIGAGNIIFNNRAPIAGNTIPVLLFKKSTAIANVPLAEYAPDPEGDVVSVTAQNTLPTGLSITSSKLTGTPTVYGQTTTQLQWVDQYGSTYSNTIIIQVGDLVPNVVGNTQATAVSTIQAVASLTANVSLVTNLNVANGTVISTDPVAGTLVPYNDPVFVYVANGSTITITTESLPSAIRNIWYSQQLTASGAVTAWSIVSGSLPTGLNLNSATGVISGTPTVINSYNFTVECTNGVTTDTQVLSIAVSSGVLGYIQIRAIPTADGIITTKFKDGNNPNGTPTLRGAPPVLSFIEGVGGSYNFGQHGADPDGDPVTYSINPSNISGVSINPTTGLFTVSASAVAAVRNYQIRITDSGAKYSEVTCQVTIAKPNRSPVFTNAPPVLSYNEGTGGSYNFAQHASDPDGDTLTYSVSPTLTGISMNVSTGILSVSAAAANGTSDLTIRATDTGGLFVEHICTLTVVPIIQPPTNDAPIFTDAPPVLSYIEGVGGSYNFAQHASDPNNDVISYSLIGTTYTGISIGNTTGILTVTPDAVAGTRNLTIRITDPGALYSQHNCSVTIVTPPQPPTDAHFIIPSTVSSWNADANQAFRTGGTRIPNTIPGCIVELSAGSSTTTSTTGTRGPLTISNLRGTSSTNPSVIRNPAAGNVTLKGSVDFIFLLQTPKNVRLDGSNGGQTYGIKSEFVSSPGGHTLKIKGMWANVHIKNIEMDGNATTYTGAGGIGFNPNDQTTVWGKGVFKSNLIIESCYVHNFQGEGMYIGANYLDYEPPIKNITVRNNIIEFCGRDGINGKNWWEGNNTISGNRITNVGLNNPDETGQLHGITSGGPAYIYNNIVENAGEHGILLGTNDGPPTGVKFGPASDLNNGGTYSYGPYTTFVLYIYNNLVINAGKATWTGITGSGIQMNADAGTVQPTPYVYNNTCVNCRAYGIQFANVYGGWFRNNVLINNTKGAYYVGNGSQANNKTTGTLSATYRLTAEDAASGTLGVDIAYTDLNSIDPSLPGISRSGVASKGAFEFVTVAARQGIYNTTDYDTGSLKAEGTNPDGAWVRAMKDSGYVDWTSWGTSLRGLGPATSYQPTNTGLTNSGTYDVKVATSFTYPATPNGSSGVVTPRTGSGYMLGMTIYKTKDYCGLNGASGPDDGDYSANTGTTGHLNKPRSFAQCAGLGQRFAWNEEVWIGYSVFLPPNFESDLGTTWERKTVRGNGQIYSIQSILGFELGASASMCGLQLLAPWNFAGLPNSNTVSWQIGGATGIYPDEADSRNVYNFWDIGAATNDIGRWTDFVFRLKINPYTTTTTIYGKTFIGNTGIMQVWKSTGTSVDPITGNRTMTRVLNRFNTAVGLAMNSSTDMMQFAAPRQYKYGWIKPFNNSTVVGPIFTAWDSIRMGKAALGASFSDVHPTQMANPTP